MVIIGTFYLTIYLFSQTAIFLLFSSRFFLKNKNFEKILIYFSQIFNIFISIIFFIFSIFFIVTSIDIKISNAYTLSTSLKNAYLFFKEIDNAGQKEKTPHFL